MTSGKETPPVARRSATIRRTMPEDATTGCRRAHRRPPGERARRDPARPPRPRRERSIHDGPRRSSAPQANHDRRPSPRPRPPPAERRRPDRDGVAAIVYSHPTRNWVDDGQPAPDHVHERGRQLPEQRPRRPPPAGRRSAATGAAPGRSARERGGRSLELAGGGASARSSQRPCTSSATWLGVRATLTPPPPTPRPSRPPCPGSR